MLSFRWYACRITQNILIIMQKNAHSVCTFHLITEQPSVNSRKRNSDYLLMSSTLLIWPKLIIPSECVFARKDIWKSLLFHCIRLSHSVCHSWQTSKFVQTQKYIAASLAIYQPINVPAQQPKLVLGFWCYGIWQVVIIFCICFPPTNTVSFS